MSHESMVEGIDIPRVRSMLIEECNPIRHIDEALLAHNIYKRARTLLEDREFLEWIKKFPDEKRPLILGFYIAKKAQQIFDEICPSEEVAGA